MFRNPDPKNPIFQRLIGARCGENKDGVVLFPVYGMLEPKYFRSDVILNLLDKKKIVREGANFWWVSSGVVPVEEPIPDAPYWRDALETKYSVKRLLDEEKRRKHFERLEQEASR